MVEVKSGGTILELSIPTTSQGTVSKTYTIIPCSGLTTGSAQLNGVSIFTSSSTNTFLSTNLFIGTYGSYQVFNLTQDPSGRYTLITVAFNLYSGSISGTNSPCSVPSLRLTRSLFTTSVNLRGGI